MRLQKYIASCGVASRRKAEELISRGRVTVNGITITTMGTQVTDTDEVTFDGNVISPEVKIHYILFNKPKGVITTASDEFGRETVLEAFKSINERIYPVGRLDCETSGLLILTNDGEFANFMTHPSNHIGKTYLVACNTDLDEADRKKLRDGVDIGDYITQKARVSEYRGPGKWNVQITIYEGRNRQIRKMIEAIGFRAIGLRRTGIGNIHDSNLTVGSWRNLSPKELRDLGYKLSK